MGEGDCRTFSRKASVPAASQRSMSLEILTNGIGGRKRLAGFWVGGAMAEKAQWREVEQLVIEQSQVSSPWLSLFSMCSWGPGLCNGVAHI